MIDDKAGILADRGRLADALQIAGAKLRTASGAIVCPFHQDCTPSGSIYQHRDSHAWRFKCHGCGFDGDFFDVSARHHGRAVGDVLKEMTAGSRTSYRPTPAKAASKPKMVYPSIEALQAAVAEQARATLEDTFQNRNPQTNAVEIIIFRLRDGGGKKTIRQARPVPGGFVQEAPPQPWPLFGRVAVAKTRPAFVVVVEGENKVKSLAGAGVVGVCGHGGALKAHHTDWTPLAGVPLVYLWPDHDALDPETGKRKGHEHMKQAGEILQKLEPAPRLMWVDPEFLGLAEDGSDVVDYLLECGGDTKESKGEAMRCALATAAPIGGSSELSDLLEDTIAGRRRAISFPFPYMTRVTRALMPGTVSCLCGDPGAGKSLFLLDMALWWHQQGIKIAIFMLEEDRAYHLNRALAQLAENAELTDPEYLRTHPEETRASYNSHSQTLDTLAPRIDAAPDSPPSYKTLIAWMRQRAQAGCRIIAIDPITAAAVSESPWIDDLNFIMDAKKIAREFACSIILTTHPRKGRKKGTGLDDLSGGASFARLSQSVFWLIRHDKPKDVRVSGPCGPFGTKINRTLRISKSRNGPGGGLDIAFIFNPRSLRFSEQGIIAGDDANDLPESETATAAATPTEQAP